jgi:hypothetical protein
MPPVFRFAPRSMDDARATLTDPNRHGCLPSVIQSNWQFLAEAKGIRLRMERLAITAHLIERPARAMPDPDATLPVTMSNGRVLHIPVTTSLAHQRAPTTGMGGLVDEIDATRARVSDRIRTMDRISGMIRSLWPDDHPKGAA